MSISFPIKYIKIAAAFCTAAYCSLAAANVSAEEISASNTGFYLDTVISIKINGTDDIAEVNDCFSLIEDYEKMFSRTIEGSDIWNVNHSNGKPVEVSDETAELIALALHYAELSDGAFNITLAPLSILWDFQNNDGYVPDPADIEEACSHVGLDKLIVDGNMVTMTDPEGAIDLGGIAKGYIADRVKDEIKEKGYDSAIINLGGNVLTVGKKPDGTNWNIGVRKPFGEPTDLAQVIKVNDYSVVTSGTYERYFEADGMIYHHILDPQTGYPVQNNLDSVTILSDYSADGDALSTTCFVLGLEEGTKLIESLTGIEAMFITKDGEFHYTKGFPHED